MNDIVAVNPGLVIGARALGLSRAADAPRLSSVQVELLRRVEVTDESGARKALRVPIERPLRVSFDGQPLVTLMTLAAAPELLTLGYLWNQRLITRLGELTAIEVDPAVDACRVTSRLGDRTVHATAMACALGSELGDVPLDPLPPSAPSHETILGILEIARAHDAVHRAAGSVHSAILFESSELLIGVEDVSRHNGVDTICGWLALHAIPGHGKTLFTTGRLTAELVLKAAHSGITTLVSRNGTTAAGCDIAARLNLTLIGRAANRRYIRYVG
jgi:FdhD protein